MNQLWTVLLAIAALMMSAASCRRHRGSSASSNNIPYGYSDSALLGQAYDSSRKRMLNNICIEGEEVVGGNQLGSIQLESDLDFSSILDKAGGDVGASTKFPLLNGGASAKLAFESRSDERSETHMVSWVGNLRKKFLKSATLKISDVGRAALAQGKESLMSRCGDEFVSEISYGGSIFIILKISYLNAADKFQVGGSMSVDLGAGVIKAGGDLSKIDDKVKRRTKVTLIAKQFGGDSTGLIRAIPADTVTCSLDDVTPCFEAFKAAIDYAKGPFQASISQGGADGANWNVINYHTERYDESGVDELRPSQGWAVVSEEAKKARELLESRYVDEVGNITRGEFIVNLAGTYFSESQISYIASVVDTARKNSLILAEGQQRCLDYPEQCKAISNETLGSLTFYDESLLKIEVESKRWANGFYYYSIVGSYFTGGKYDDAADKRAIFDSLIRIDTAVKANGSVVGGQNQLDLMGIRLVYKSGRQVVHGDMNTRSVQSLDVKGDSITSIKIYYSNTPDKNKARVKALAVTTWTGHFLFAGNPSNPFISVDVPSDETFIGFAGSSGTEIDSLGVVTRI